MTRVPRRTGGPPRVPLSPEEEHLLKVVDGVLDIQDLTLVTGTSESKTLEVLERLAMIGLVVIDEGEDEDRDAHLPPEAEPDEVDLTPAERTEIETFARMLGRATFYELLGITRDANESDIKRAYYRLAPKFHPDRHFGKEIGPYKPMIEAVFSALTKAHDTLRSGARRDKYDDHLPPARPTQRPPAMRQRRESDPGRASVPDARESMPSQPDITREEARRTQPSVGAVPPPRARMASNTSGSGVSPGGPGAMEAPSAPPMASVPPVVSTPPPPRISKTPDQVRAERASLARKLAGQKIVNSRKAGRHATEVKTTQREAGTFKAQTDVRRSAAEAMRRRFDTLGEAAKEKRLQRYLEQGATAMEAGDYRAAVSAFEQAVRIVPDDPEVLEKLQTAAALAQGD